MLSLIALTALTATAQAETASVGLALRQADSLMTGVQATFTPPGPLQLHARLLGQAGPTPGMAEALQHATGEAAITDNLGWTELELRLLPTYRVWGAKTGDNGLSLAVGVDAVHLAYPGRTDSLGTIELTPEGASSTRVGAHARVGMQLDLLGMGADLGQELTGFLIGGTGIQARTNLRLNLGLPWIELGVVAQNGITDAYAAAFGAEGADRALALTPEFALGLSF